MRSSQRLLLGAIFTVLAAFAVVIYVKFIIDFTGWRGGDLRIFYTAAWIFTHHQDFYINTHYLNSVEIWLTRANPHIVSLPYPYMPWTILLFVPFTFLSFQAALFFWDILLAIILFCTSVWLVKHFGGEFKTARLWALFLAISPLALVNYMLGQISLIAYLFFILGLVCLVKKQYLWLGICLALAALIKPQDAAILIPLSFLLPLPSLIHKRNLIIGEVLAGIIILGAQFLFMRHLFFSWLHLILHFSGNITHLPLITGLSGLLRWSVWGHHLDASIYTEFSFLITIIGVVAILGLAYKGRVSKWGRANQKEMSELMLIGGCALWLLFSPYGHVQDFVFLLPLLILILSWSHYRLNTLLDWIVMFALFVLTFVPSLLSNFIVVNTSINPLVLVVFLGSAYFAVRNRVLFTQGPLIPQELVSP